MVNTTILLDTRTRDALARSRDRLGASSMDEAVRRIMRDATLTAQELWRLHRRRVEKVVHEHHVRRLIAFGSRVRDDRHPGSDLDVVVDFPTDGGMRAFFALRDALTDAFGVPVDIGDIPPEDSRLWTRIKQEGISLVGPPP